MRKTKLAGSLKYWGLLPTICLLVALPFTAQASDELGPVAPHLDKSPSLYGNLIPGEWSDPAAIGAVSFRLSYDATSIYLDVEGKKAVPRTYTLAIQGLHRSDTLLISSSSPNLKVAKSKAGENYRLVATIPWKATTLTPEDGPFTIGIKPGGAVGRAVTFLLTEKVAAKKQGEDLHLEPFVVGSANTENNGYGNVGLDYSTRYRNLDILGSISPDFRTVERAILNLDFSYYERFAPETRPFFLAGAGYYAPTFLNTQTIDTFNAGEKVYGNLDPTTRLGIMDTANFWDQNEFALGLSRDLSPNATVSGGFKDMHDLNINNQDASGSFYYKDGPFRFSSDLQVTHDDQLGGGSSGDAKISYSKNGAFATVTALDTSSQFFDRLGFYTQPDIRGIDAAAGAYKHYSRGALAGSGFSLFTLQFQSQNGSLFQNYVGGSGSIDLRNGVSLTGSYTSGRFEANKDRFGEVTLSDSALGGRGRVGLQFTEGLLASSNYTNVLPYFAYRFTPRFEVSGSFQAVRQFENQTQTIVHFNYGLGKNQSLSGRAVEFQNQWNAYVRYRNEVNKHFIYEVIVGDPNALRTQRALWLKMIFPMDVKF